MRSLRGALLLLAVGVQLSVCALTEIKGLRGAGGGRSDVVCLEEHIPKDQLLKKLSLVRKHAQYLAYRYAQ